MTYLYAGLLLAVNTLSLLLVVVGLPGNWLMVLAACVAAWLEPGMFSGATLVALAALALLGEVAEFIAGAAGSRRAGGSLRSSAGAIVFGIIGAVAGTFLLPIPVVGSLAGACTGAFAGALLGEIWAGKQIEPALEVGRAAFVGRLVGTGLKLAFGAAIWLVATAASFW